MRPNLTVLRSAIGPMLTETGTVQRPGEGWVYDPVTGTEVQQMETIYSGPLLVRPRGVDPQSVEVGGRTDYVSKYDVTLPAETEAGRDDVLTVTTTDTDPALVGVRFRILDAPVDPWQVARFCVAERVT